MEPVVIEHKTQIIVTTPVFVSGENLPAVRPSTPLRSAQDGRGKGKRGLAIESNADVQRIEALAADAMLALREWQRHAEMCRDAGLTTDRVIVSGYIKRIVDLGADVDGVAALVLLDVDKPSPATIREHRGSVRDHLVWLASQEMAPGHVGLEDAKAFKVFLQADGAPELMERLRAEWLGRAPRILYTPDPRDVVMWLAGLGMTQARARAKTRGWAEMLLAVSGSFAHQPRPAHWEFYKNETVALKLTVIRSFYKSALARQGVYLNPFVEVKAGKGKTSKSQRVRSRNYSRAEVSALLEGCSEELVHEAAEKAKSVRDKCIIACGAVLALRISEVCALTVQHYLPQMGEHGALFIQGAKGEKDRYVDITPKFRALLEKWLAYRQMMKPATNALFVSMHWGDAGYGSGGQALTTRGVRAMFDERQKALGIKRDGRSFHGLRHHMATQVLKAGGNLNRLSQYMGHASVTTTQVYIDVNDLDGENPAAFTDDVL